MASVLSWMMSVISDFEASTMIDSITYLCAICSVTIMFASSRAAGSTILVMRLRMHLSVMS